MTNVPVDLQMPGPEPYPLELLGNDLLKRFDVFIDYHDEAIYLRPNLHLHAPYDRARSLGQWMLWSAMFAAIAGLSLVLYRWKRGHAHDH